MNVLIIQRYSPIFFVIKLNLVDTSRGIKSKKFPIIFLIIGKHGKALLKISFSQNRISCLIITKKQPSTYNS